jgi:BirA family biotin operon repressor/biotin-[acetyl-CoA-carboxylase] ligase
MASSKSGAPDSKFSPSDIDLVLTNTFVQAVDYYEELPSTNTHALQLAARSHNQGPSPLLVMAELQTAGRGRGANRWWSDHGSLTFSVLFRPQTLALPPSRWPQLSLVAGLAVCDAIEYLNQNLRPSVKWPNDVLIDGYKVGGILVEAADGRRGNLVVGVGVNVNNVAERAPPDLREYATALCNLSAVPIHRVDVLVAILQRLEARISWLLSDPEALRTDWSRRCILTGRTVEIEIHSRRILGICEGIDREGALILRTPSGQERCLSGTIVKYD